MDIVLPLPGTSGISQEQSDPLCPLLICISKKNFCPTAVVPTGFAGVVVMQLLLRALLAFQSPGVQGNIRVDPKHPSTAGEQQQHQGAKCSRLGHSGRGLWDPRD